MVCGTQTVPEKPSAVRLGEGSSTALAGQFA